MTSHAHRRAPLTPGDPRVLINIPPIHIIIAIITIATVAGM